MNSKKDITEAFLEERHMEGVVIPQEYFWDLFGLQMPRKSTPRGEAQPLDFQFAGNMRSLRRELLVVHKLDLQNARGKGYRLVPFQERVDLATRDGRKAARKALRDYTERLTHIPHVEQLPFPQRLMREAALATNSAIESMLRRPKRYPE